MVTELVYRLYERRLAAGLRGGPLPRHVGVIVDGNRRFAQERGASVTDGHRLGASKIPQLLDWCAELGIDYLTLWLLSTENLEARDADEVDALVGIIGEMVHAMATDPRNRARGVRVTAVGALDVIPEDLRSTLKRAAELTADAHGMHVQVAVGYGGRQEITDALRGLLEERAARGQTLVDVIEDLRPEDIAANLYTAGAPDPDLIIRTSGEIRLSGFLMWQSAHSEFYFCDPYWPAFRKTDFLRALRDFQSRGRRFGA